MTNHPASPHPPPETPSMHSTHSTRSTRSTLPVPHRFELMLEVRGDADVVWRAIASAGGISSWMMPAELDPREGGAVAFHMGPDATSHGRVTGYEPARRFAYEEDWATLIGRPGADVTPLATEFLIEARSGGTCVVRVITSAFGTGADWETEFWDEMVSGWAPMLDNLRLYLAHFPDQRATPMWAGTTLAATPEGAIAATRAALGVDGAGDDVRARDVSGRVERSGERYVLLRVDRPVPGFLSFYSFGADDDAGLHLQGYLFSDAAADYVGREQPGWQAWLDGLAEEVRTRGAPAVPTVPTVPPVPPVPR